MNLITTFNALLTIIYVHALGCWLALQLATVEGVPRIRHLPIPELRSPTRTYIRHGFNSRGIFAEVQVDGTCGQVASRDALQFEVSTTGINDHSLIGIVELIVSTEIQQHPVSLRKAAQQAE